MVCLLLDVILIIYCSVVSLFEHLLCTVLCPVAQYILYIVFHNDSLTVSDSCNKSNRQMIVNIQTKNLFIFLYINRWLWQEYLLNAICFRPLIIQFICVHVCLYVTPSPTVHLCALCSPLNLGDVVVSSVSANLHAIYVFICFCSSEHCE